MTTDDAAPAIPPGLAHDIERALSNPSSLIRRPRPARHSDLPVADYADAVRRHADELMTSLYGKLETEVARLAAAGHTVTDVDWRIEADPDAPVGSVRLVATIAFLEG